MIEGGELEKGEWGDTDQIVLADAAVLPDTGAASQPGPEPSPSVYSLVRRGDYYDVWQRPADATGGIAEHLPLGDFEDPGPSQNAPSASPWAEPGRHRAAAKGADRERLAGECEPSLDWIPTEAGSPDLIPHGPGRLG